MQKLVGQLISTLVNRFTIRRNIVGCSSGKFLDFWIFVKTWGSLILPVNLDVFLKYRGICLSILDIDSLHLDLFTICSFASPWLSTRSVCHSSNVQQAILNHATNVESPRVGGGLGKVMAILR